MGLGSRTARLHATARAVEALNQAEGSTWDFQPGERVMTVDGFPGVIAAVHDGPFQGNEEYEVTLDGGLGGGAYTASQLRQLSGGATAVTHTAADDYPELGSILTERPDIAINTVLGSKQVEAESTRVGEAPDYNGDYADYADSFVCPDCGGHRALNSADGTVKCENCGYLEAGDKQTGADAKTSSLQTEANGDMQEARQQSQKASDGATCKDCGLAKYDSKPGDSCPLCDGQMTKVPTKWATKSWDLIVHAAESPSFLMAVTSSWSDVKAKAKRLRSEDGVNITAVAGGQVIAHVTGDHGTYETVLQHHLGANTGVSAWNCGCAWARYAWGRSGSYKRYEGRMCSHALATQLEALARGVFGDAHPENYGAKVAASMAPEAPVAFLVNASLAAGDDPAEVVLALRTAGIQNAQGFVHLAGSGDPSGDTTGEGIGSTSPGTGVASPTRVMQPNENPASTGWASGPDPKDWGQASPFGRMGSVDEAWDEPEMSKEAMPALLPLAAPLVRAVAPTVVKKVLPNVMKNVVKNKVMDALNPFDKNEEEEQDPQRQPEMMTRSLVPTYASAESLLEEEPEGALPQTDGNEDPDGDVQGLASHGSVESVEDIVAQFQATAGVRLMESGPKGGDDGGMNVALAAKMALKDFSAAEQQDLINEGATEGVTASNLDRLDIAGTHYEALEAALASHSDDDDLEF